MSNLRSYSCTETAKSAVRNSIVSVSFRSSSRATTTRSENGCTTTVTATRSSLALGAYLNVISVSALEVVNPTAEDGLWVSLQPDQHLRHKKCLRHTHIRCIHLQNGRTFACSTRSWCSWRSVGVAAKAQETPRSRSNPAV